MADGKRVRKQVVPFAVEQASHDSPAPSKRVSGVSVLPPRAKTVFTVPSGRREDPAERLPVEVFLYILGHLCTRDLVATSLVCRAWRNITEDPSLWLGLLRQLTAGQDDYSKIPRLSLKKTFMDRYSIINLVENDPRWDRYHRAPTGKARCWFCSLTIEMGSLRFYAHVFEHQTPPLVHAGCDVKFNVHGQTFNPNKTLNYFQEEKFASHPNDLTYAEKQAITAWIRDGCPLSRTPALLGPRMADNTHLELPAPKNRK